MYDITEEKGLMLQVIALKTIVDDLFRGKRFFTEKGEWFQQAVYPEFYKASDDEIVILKMLVELLLF
ncbi:MAG: hypothetical protein JXN62_08915 [Bacteroidales bacterium]|nr:hypothetical protein [Bacteroidales bacterium]